MYTSVLLYQLLFFHSTSLSTIHGCWIQVSDLPPSLGRVVLDSTNGFQEVAEAQLWGVCCIVFSNLEDIQKLDRITYIGQGLGKSFRFSTGLLEGDSMSLLGMVALSIIFYYTIVSPQVTPHTFSFKKSWLIIGKQWRVQEHEWNNKYSIESFVLGRWCQNNKIPTFTWCNCLILAWHLFSETGRNGVTHPLHNTLDLLAPSSNANACCVASKASWNGFGGCPTPGLEPIAILQKIVSWVSYTYMYVCLYTYISYIRYVYIYKIYIYSTYWKEMEFNITHPLETEVVSPMYNSY